MTGLERFYNLLDGYKNTISWAIGGSAILPLISTFAGLAPIWPAAVALLTSLTNLICVVMAFQFFERAGRRRINSIMLRSLIAMIISFISYFFLIATFVTTIPTNGERIYLGCGWSSMSLELVDDYRIDPERGCPGNYLEILKAAEYESEIVWSQSSVDILPVIILVVWLIAFTCLSIFLSSFLVYQSRR